MCRPHRQQLRAKKRLKPSKAALIVSCGLFRFLRSQDKKRMKMARQLGEKTGFVIRLQSVVEIKHRASIRQKQCRPGQPPMPTGAPKRGVPSRRRRPYCWGPFRVPELGIGCAPPKGDPNFTNTHPPKRMIQDRPRNGIPTIPRPICQERERERERHSCSERDRMLFCVGPKDFS